MACSQARRMMTSALSMSALASATLICTVGQALTGTRVLVALRCGRRRPPARRRPGTAQHDARALRVDINQGQDFRNRGTSRPDLLNLSLFFVTPSRHPTKLAADSPLAHEPRTRAPEPLPVSGGSAGLNGSRNPATVAARHYIPENSASPCQSHPPPD